MTGRKRTLERSVIVSEAFAIYFSIFQNHALDMSGVHYTYLCKPLYIVCMHALV